MATQHADWPAIPFEPWSATASALHLFLQIVGKYRLARTPWLNHSWHATFYVAPRGLTTSPIPDGGAQIELLFDLLDHRLIASSSSGASFSFPLGPMSVSDFHRRTAELIRDVGGSFHIHGRPSEIPDALPFREDKEPRPYDADAVERYFRALLAIDSVFRHFRTGFLGKSSPVHLFWGAMDLAVTRFSGRLAPRHPGGIPALPDAVTREAYSHEVSSAGFWPGGNGIDYPAFYSYSYPAPPGFAEASVQPRAAFFHAPLGEFILPYDSVRQADDPAATLLSFLQSTYQAAASLRDWDTAALSCALGVPGRPRRDSVPAD